MMADKDTLKDDKEGFKLAVEAEKVQRKASLDDIKFARLGEQWLQADIDKRRAEGRPCLTINKLPSFIRQVVNDGRRNRPQIKVAPVGNGSNKETAHILNGLIKNIEVQSGADAVYDTALDNSVTAGVGYMIARVDYTDDDSFDTDIVIERVGNIFSIFGDPNSKSVDSRDWNRAYIVDALTKAQFKQLYPGAEAAKYDLSGADEVTQMWFEDDHVRVAECWTRDEVKARLLRLSDESVMFEQEYLKIKDLLDAQGVQVVGDRPSKTYRVTQRIISGCEILSTNEWRGKYIPIIPVYGDEVNVEGKRYFQSLIRFAKDPQRMFNYWRTASTELVALAPKAPYIGRKGAFNTDIDKWQTANTVSHPFIEFDGEQAPQRQPFSGVPAGALQEALNASDDMKAILGIYDASLGARSNETSGRAIMARQREGDISTYHFIDNLSRGVEHLGRVIVDLIPKVYTVPRIIRCVKPDGGTYQVPINQPVIPGKPNEPGMQPEQFERAQAEIEGLTTIFDLTAGKYDVVVNTGPSFTSQREESAAQIMEFIRVFPQAAPLIGDILAQNFDWQGGEEIAARLKAMLPPQASGMVNPLVQQLQQQLQQQDQMAKQAVATLQGQIQEMGQKWQQEQQKVQSMQVDQTVEIEKVKIDQFKAETDRIKVQNDAQRAQIEAARLQMDAMQVMKPETETVEVEEPEVKTITITAPSGNTYTGTIVEGKVSLSGPNGDYQGTMKEGM